MQINTGLADNRILAVAVQATDFTHLLDLLLATLAGLLARARSRARGGGVLVPVASCTACRSS